MAAQGADRESRPQPGRARTLRAGGNVQDAMIRRRPGDDGVAPASSAWSRRAGHSLETYGRRPSGHLPRRVLPCRRRRIGRAGWNDAFEPPDRVRAAVFGAATRSRPGGLTPLKLLLAAALLLAALAGTTVAVGTLLKLVAAPTSPIQWSAVPSGAALVQDNGTLRLERVAASGQLRRGRADPRVPRPVTSSDGRTWIARSTPGWQCHRLDVHGDEASSRSSAVPRAG
jgi:hypothetical protein